MPLLYTPLVSAAPMLPKGAIHNKLFLFIYFKKRSSDACHDAEWP